MGNYLDKDELIISSIQQQPVNEIETRIQSSTLTNLDKGGFIIRTSVGNIQYGIPPETIKDSMKKNQGVPEYFIIPSKKFDWACGISLMEFEFPLYFNFFIRKQTKTKIICDRKSMK